ncbi:DeoR/GlpR family DNA-binding transcription regulator [Novosphingobium sp. 1949]|uniref:DeoR/GlpR family DNA-binding transcription regulator n=2 Tax=Novosphingobium organovorum TaxID=2930092 RepID=A0ABT0BES6_9SPHN|nr:DeoR/GlpR family DNA-binding transcription regulator [Novosphingobium organovorum]
MDTATGAGNGAGESDIVSARRAHILQIARSAGSVSVDDLAERLAVTPQTIRKDLNVLARQALLSRVHGGALVTSGVDNLAYDARRTVASQAKARIGAAAAALIPDGASLFVNIGTTTEAVAANFAHHRNLMVISNNLNVVDTLSSHPAMELVSVGGKVRTSDRAVVGALAMRFIENFRVDYALIGISALDADGSLLDFAIDEVEVSQTIIRNARKVILVADSAKIGRSAPVRVCGMEAIDFFVTDRIADPILRAACERHGVNLIETAPDA